MNKATMIIIPLLLRLIITILNFILLEVNAGKGRLLIVILDKILSVII